ncbi:hypothetical protein [Aliterella atlantica]|uniref:HEPN domain-containing protein n=1 Tax=Aliterella atlantica CENA595 TaxID=1618023 RepID=A0A0D8ZR07_9CYAN|nr:hypothetical protein [Aliterella atlantica]KJH70772.1 hypothetical protein UH38_16205 [Aliterella atlantica CENA595]
MINKTFSSSKQRNWQNEAMAGGKYLLDSNNHIHGYYKAADILVNSALDSHINRDRDMLFFPIVFNYRHYIELSLKNLIEKSEDCYDALEQTGSNYGSLKSRFKNNLNHHLKPLLNHLTERLLLIGEVGFEESICETILDIHKLDPESITFRYPIKKKGDLTLPEQESYDLKNIQERMKIVKNSFEGATIELQVKTDLALEWLSIQQEQISEFETELPKYDFENNCY